MFLLILPYLFAAARRLELFARPLHVIEGALIGLAAALGFSLKPQFLSLLIGVEALLIYRTRDCRIFLRPELGTIVLAGLTYIAAVWLITPNYFTTTVPTLAPAYAEFYHQTVREIMSEPMVLRVIITAAIALCLLRGSVEERLASIFLIAGLGGFVAFLMQGKGWPYHLLPAEMLVTLSLAVGVIGHFLRLATRRDYPNVARSSLWAATIATCLITIGLYYSARTRLLADSDQEQKIAEIDHALSEFSPGTTIAALPVGWTLISPAILDREFVWASRFPVILLPQATVQQATLTNPQKNPIEEHTDNYLLNSKVFHGLFGRSAAFNADGYVRELRANMVEDLIRWRPKIVVIDRCLNDRFSGCSAGRGFDVIEWLSIDPTFAAMWLQYKFLRHVEPYDFYEFFDAKDQ
jgi:hypothetical protein